MFSLNRSDGVWGPCQRGLTQTSSSNQDPPGLLFFAMSFALAHVRRNRKVILLFALMVLLPAAMFSMFLARSVRSDRLDAARQEAERRRQIARLVEDDLSNWLFSIGPDSARSKAFVRFELAGDTVVFPDLRLSLPVAVRPARSTSSGFTP